MRGGLTCPLNSDSIQERSAPFRTGSLGESYQQRGVMGSIKKPVFLLVLAAAGACSGCAQSTAQIQGAVRDATGGAVPGAEVKATQTATFGQINIAKNPRVVQFAAKFTF